MRATEITEARITDQYGREHLYRIQPWPARKGFKLLAELARILGRPAGDLLAAISEVSIVGTVAEGLLDRLLAAGPDDLALRILAGTRRQSEHSASDFDAMDDPVIFDGVYAANYVELVQAVYQVIRINIGPFSLATFPSLSGLWERLATQLLPTIPTGTPPAGEPGTPPASTPSRPSRKAAANGPAG